MLKIGCFYKYFLLLLCIISQLELKGQHLLKSSRTSFYTYIYKINNKQARQIYKNANWEVDSTFFYNKIDSFPTGEAYKGPLAEGHYLKTFSEENQQKVSITSIQKFEAFILNNNTDLQIQVYDLEGELIPNAILKIRKRKIRFQKQDSAYILKKANKKGLLEIKVNDFVAFYNLERELNNSWTKRAFRRVVYGTPLKYAWKPVIFTVNIPIDGVKSLIRWWPQGTIYNIKEFFVKVFYNVACLFDEYYCDYYGNRNKDKHTGYLAFNKPKYLPGDTVKLKAFVVKNNGKPINKNLNATVYHRGKNRILSTIVPYRKGAYQFEFVLHDSLDLQLDRNYRLNLQSNRGKDYISGYFKYEDYELKSTELKTRTEQNQHYKSDTAMLYAKGTNENNLNILDGRLEILVTPLEIDKFFRSEVFVPDTLLYMEKLLDPEQETEIAIIDNEFPALNFDYNVNIKLITADNEVVSKDQRLTYWHKRSDFTIELKTDSIQFSYLKNGIRKSRRIKIYKADNFGNRTQIFEGLTPTNISYNQYFSTYIVQSDSLEKTFDLSREPALIQCYSDRTTDSLIIQIDNPRNLPFSYNLYRKNKEIISGYGTELSYKIKTRSAKNYFISLQYLWGGEIRLENYEIPLKDKKLNIAILQPRIVYPGQKSRIELAVTNIKGAPVKGVDLTAYSVTKKFGYRPPSLPYLGKEGKHKALINNFNFDNGDFSNSSTDQLNYPNWKKQAGLDSIEYYQFIYPEHEIKKFTYITTDSITQFSPFIFKEGASEPVHVIYVDGKPVYFSWSNHENPYSFAVDSGYHQIKLRTQKNLFKIDSLYFQNGKKLIFSLDNKSSNERISTTEMEAKLNAQERNLLYKYVFPYRNNFGERFAYIKQGEQLQLLNGPSNTLDYGNLAGPIVGSISFHMMESYSTSFQHEPFFEYDFAPKLLKMRSVPTGKYPGWLWRYSLDQNLSDSVITEKKLKSVWKDYLESKRSLTATYNYPKYTEKGAGRLLIKELKNENCTTEKPVNILIFRYDDHKFLRIYPGRTSLFHDLKKGYHKLLFFYPDAKYYIEDSVHVEVNGLNYLEYKRPKILRQDSFSLEIDRLIEANIFKSRPYNFGETQQKTEISRIYRERFKYSGAGEIIEGYVYDEQSEEPLPGVSVLIKGTSYGTTTDLQGYYSLKIPYGYNTLQFSFIGMSSQEKEISNNTINVGLMADVQQLSEVVVTGYGIAHRSDLSASFATSDLAHGLQGKVAGVTISSGAPGSALSVKIRGASTLSFKNTPLYIVNGAVYTGDISKINPDVIKSIETLKSESAIALYGSKAANGVLIIDTEEGAFRNPQSLSNKGANYDESFFDTALQASAIRNNFSDYAFWQPKLSTDKDGKASFEVLFPDDVTSWETFYLAMTDNRQSGQNQGLIMSYKPLMAQLALPRFLVATDTAIGIGKVLNYANDSILITSQFEINNKNQFSKNLYLKNSIIDSLAIIAPADSVTIKYFMEKKDGYFDGEQKQVPVFPMGLEETEGSFYTLEHDTTFSLSFNSDLGDAHLFARADLLNIVEDEINHVLRCEYYCNEQIASKIKVLLVRKKIAEVRKLKFRDEMEIKKLIRLLYKNQTGKGLWGWWKESAFNEWISLHALEAMVLAEKQGYETKINKEQITEQMIWQLEYKPDFDKSIKILTILQLLDAKVDYSSYINSLDEHKAASVNALLAITRLKQLCQINYEIDTLLLYQKRTLLGNLYFENESEKDNLITNDLQNTLMVYQILQADSSLYRDKLQDIRGYFLEIRNNGYWRNTYESAKIIETILPDLLNGKPELIDPKIIISGDVNKTIMDFPFEMKVRPDQAINISKSGSFPIYVTSYQRFWNNQPRFKKEDFEINSEFENDVQILNAGKELKLIVNIKVKKDAEYVMINIPIPASCSYANKKNNFGVESHREYFKNKTTIFCEKLPKGDYSYEINLIPRFSGTYTLNPAKIELMYFPTFNANNNIKSIKVR